MESSTKRDCSPPDWARVYDDFAKPIKQWYQEKQEEAIQRYRETKDDRFLDDAGRYEQMASSCDHMVKGRP